MKRGWFEKFAERTAKLASSKYAFGFAIAVVVIWAACGPYFNYSDSWNLFINSLTTVITFWMGFLILNATGRESKALSVKIDELIRANARANNKLIGLEEKTETEIVQAAQEIKEVVKDGG